MNAEVKAKWVAALRSGEYKQATGALSEGNGFCCLGVLCDLSAKEGRGAWNHVAFEIDTRRAMAMPPAPVAAWAGLSGEDMDRIATMNDDDGCSFVEIADHIDRNL